MSDNTMSDRVELAEALRSILDDPYSGTEDEKENIAKTKTGFKDALPRAASFRSGIKTCLTPINKTLSYTRQGCSPKSVLTPSADQLKDGAVHGNKRRVGFEDEQSPPKKRRHANHVIILRQPRGQGKQQKSSPESSADGKAQSKPSEAPCPTGSSIGSRRSNKEFTVELDSGIGGQQLYSNTSVYRNQDIEGTVDPTCTHRTRAETACGINTADAVNTPPRSVRNENPSSAEKCLDAAIECQIKSELSEEELESGLPVLDGLDPTASPFCHFADVGQQQLYSELSALDVGGSPWPTSQGEALQMAASQQMLQCAEKFYFAGGGGQPYLPGEGSFGRWVTRVGSADDSLTNITWLKRMSAPDLDPNLLQTAQMMDPRFERPPYSYSTLIQFAISSSQSGKMTLREIYAWIEETFPYFKTAKPGWRNSIRHNLSLHKIFIREPPMTHGHLAFWTLRPGTVVRLPERRMFVADRENGGTLLQEVAPTPTMLPPAMGGQQQGAPFFMSGAVPQVVMVPRPLGGVASTSSSKDSTGLGPKTKRPPLILPRGSQPYALVPVPLLLPPNQNGGQTPGDGPAAVPHILSPLLMGGLRRFAVTSAPQVVGGRKVVPIAPKLSLGDGAARLPSMHGGSGSSTSACNTSSDSGVDLSAQSLTPGPMLTSDRGGSAVPGTPKRGLPFKKQGKGRKSLPKIREGIDEADGEDSFTAFFEQELASPPRTQKALSKGMPVVSTPCKPINLQTWLSPLRGFTPFKTPPLDGDSGIFQDLHGDLSLTPLPASLTPDFRSSHRAAARGPRSRMGSLGELGLPGLTPEKGALSSDGIHNQSFGQIFGDLVGLDVENDGLDVGNLSWSMFSPGKQPAT